MRCFLSACCLLTTVSCGPVDPTPRPLDLQAGTYLLIVSGAGACSSAAFIPGVGALLAVLHEGTDWVGRSPTEDDGSLELRFHEVFDSRIAGVAVAGTLSGVARDHRPVAAAGNAVSVSGDSSRGASVSAESTPNAANVISGRISGRLIFTDNSGTPPFTCPMGNLSLRVPVPCELAAGVVCP